MLDTASLKLFRLGALGSKGGGKANTSPSVDSAVTSVHQNG